MGKKFWVGGYSPDGGGTSLGIRAIEIGNGVLTDLGLAHVADSPSWLATHPGLPVLYAALEHRGEVAVYRIVDVNRLEPLGGPVEAGALVCHLAVAGAGTTLIASCYGDGRVLSYPIHQDGSLGDPALAPASVDPFAVPGHHPRASRSHQSTVLRSGRIITTDLGHDSLRIWELVAGGLRQERQITLRKGDGPRHLVEHPSGLVYVVTEHSAQVVALAADAAGEWREVSRESLGDGILAGEHFPAEISLDRHTNRLYVGVRGARAMAVLGLKGGRPVFLGAAPCAGDWPRHHVQVGNSLLVANQLSNTIEALGLDAEDGLPSKHLSSLALESPTCIVAQIPR
ncbi:lactonase family protein [Paeniglutamicibacter sp. ABSL32-1]|uniref:lactonase family protein n=1 Tax=Paeniglutamicibacter quisquiliarum TaxID=2849498 RepID=UPI001C2D9DF4|nr:beta-propeller fold lactonase family protein [Paeniglutamicibacter quisquiliarum]MBV1780983.1 lactonase family protein [Paeniglutamicibacter quisquiliarum]